MLVEGVMTTPVVAIKPTASVLEAAKLMLAHGISGLPVVADDGSLMGIVTEGDFLRRGELGTERKRSRWLEFFTGPGRAADDYVHAFGRKVAEVMSEDVVTVDRKMELSEAVELMLAKRIKRLPVLENGGLAGIVTRADLMRALVRTPAPEGTVKSTDEEICDAILAELAKQRWAGRDLVRVKVNHGVAELSGMILDERARLAARVAAENVPGVVSVDDQLIWVEPFSGTVIVGSGDVFTPARPPLT